MPSQMFGKEGQRKYLTREETAAFLRAARMREPAVAAFCWIVAASGCRISEALALCPQSIDFAAQQVVIECLKKRGKTVFRAVPLPPALLSHLRAWIPANLAPADRLWPWSRMTGYRRICEVMAAAGIRGPHASPKGLRHGFGVGAIQTQIPLNLVQRWLGHADMKTTAIYTSVTGPEERSIAERMWSAVAVPAPPQADDAPPYRAPEPMAAPDRPDGIAIEIPRNPVVPTDASASRRTAPRLLSAIRGLRNCRPFASIDRHFSAAPAPAARDGRRRPAAAARLGPSLGLSLILLPVVVRTLTACVAGFGASII